MAITQGNCSDGYIFAVILLGIMITYRAQFGIGSGYLHEMTSIIDGAKPIRRELRYDLKKLPLVEHVLRVAMSIFIRISVSRWRLLEFDGEPKAELEDTWTNMVAAHDFVHLTLETFEGNEFMFHILPLMHRAT